MRTRSLAALAAASIAVCACGGGGGNTADDANTQTFSFTTPDLGATDTWSRVYVDDAFNSVTTAFRQRVSAVDTDRSFSLQYDDPTDTDSTVNGITYHVDPETERHNAAGGVIDYTQTLPDGSQRTCAYTFAQNAAVQDDGSARATALALQHAASISVGQNWSDAYTVACSGVAPVAYTLSGSAVDTETITVPAGSFRTLKVTETVSWTTAANQIITESVIVWEDPSHSLFPVQVDVTYERHGTLPAHYVVHETQQLLSRS